MLRLLRRIAVLALVAAALLLTVPRALYHYGFLGPASAHRVDDARQAVAVARGYGARPDIPAMAAAERELAAAEAARACFMREKRWRERSAPTPLDFVE